jgi:hypothetical protein
VSSGRVKGMSANEMQMLRRTANGEAVIALIQCADVARLTEFKLIEFDVRRAYLTEHGREFLTSQEAGE